MATQETVSSILSDAGMTIVIGLVVVFCVLLLLTGVFKLFGTLMGRSGDGERIEEESGLPLPARKPTVPPTPVPITGNSSPVTASPAVQNGIPDETVAAISAVVASLSPADTQYAVHSIRKA